jgi:hypothetical protein
MTFPLAQKTIVISWKRDYPKLRIIYYTHKSPGRITTGYIPEASCTYTPGLAGAPQQAAYRTKPCQLYYNRLCLDSQYLILLA